MKIPIVCLMMTLLTLLTACSGDTTTPMDESKNTTANTTTNANNDSENSSEIESHPFIEQCTYTENNLINLAFTYREFLCDNDEAYADLGDSILTSLNSKGYGFSDQELDLELWEFEFEQAFNEDEQLLVTYFVERNTLEEIEREELSSPFKELAADREQHEYLWGLFTRLIPEEFREEIVYFTTFAHDSTTGYVEPYILDGERIVSWLFAMNVLDIEPGEKRINTILHEWAHTYTLGNGQLDPDVEEEECPSLFLEHGCSMDGSLIEAFYDRFWTDHDEYVSTINHDQDLIYEYYLENEEQFVHEYAAMSVEEDIAESFAYFVLETKPAGDLVKDEKVLFFYEYPELISFRAEVLSRLDSLIEHNHVKWVHED